MKNILGIRGAITVQKNSASAIKKATVQLLKKLFKENNLKGSNIINLIFTVTNDLTALNPATAAREEFKLNSTPVICVQEMKVKNSLKKCIRVLIQAQANLIKQKVKHIYLGKAANLRPDLVN